MKEKNSKKHADNYQFDEDRMINEGLAGGTVQSVYDAIQINQAEELKKEKPPNE